jgi:hypothetical protein
MGIAVRRRPPRHSMRSWTGRPVAGAGPCVDDMLLMLVIEWLSVWETGWFLVLLVFLYMCASSPARLVFVVVRYI